MQLELGFCVVAQGCSFWTEGTGFRWAALFQVLTPFRRGAKEFRELSILRIIESAVGKEDTGVSESWGPQATSLQRLKLQPARAEVLCGHLGCLVESGPVLRYED